MRDGEEGCLNLYVKSFGSNGKIDGNINKGGDVSALMMYCQGETISISMEKENEFCGTLFVDGNLEMKKDGNISGNIIVIGESCSIDCDKDLEINGVIYAPYSSVSFKKSTTVNGTVIADHYL